MKFQEQFLNVYDDNNKIKGESIQGKVLLLLFPALPLLIQFSCYSILLCSTVCLLLYAILMSP